jgi:hypothetical protein
MVRKEQTINNKQKNLLSAFRKALLHNRLLLTLLSSNAFKTYFDMLDNFYGERLLPARQQIPFYRAFEKTLRPKIVAEDAKLKQYFTLPHTFRPDPRGVVGFQADPSRFRAEW